MRARTFAAAALSAALAGCGPLLFVGNEVALHKVAFGLVKQLLAGQRPDIQALVDSAMTETPTEAGGEVREDVASWVKSQKLTAQQTAALMQLAQATQAALTVDVKDPQALRSVAMAQIAAVQCVARRGGELIGGESAAGVIASMTADTAERQALFRAFSLAVAGMQRMASPIGDGCA